MHDAINDNPPARRLSRSHRKLPELDVTVFPVKNVVNSDQNNIVFGGKLSKNAIVICDSHLKHGRLWRGRLGRGASEYSRSYKIISNIFEFFEMWMY
jgi:hypothetical protein